MERKINLKIKSMYQNNVGKSMTSARIDAEHRLSGEIHRFNNQYSVGSKVKIKTDSGEIKEVTVESPATILGGHSAVGWFEEISGCYSLDRVINN